MPIYEYVCEACGQDFEKMVRFSESELAPVCPACGSQETHKEISRVSSALGVSGSEPYSTSSCGGSGRFT